MRFTLKKIIKSFIGYKLLTASFAVYSSLALSQPLYNTSLVETLKDSDLDGVIDARDLCEKTPEGAEVDNNGCPIINLQHFSVDLGIPFEKNSYKLETKYFSNLENVAKFLKQVPEALILIEGHTDNSGTANYNLLLSKKRAEAIANALISNFKISAERIKAIGYGQERPIAPNDTEANRMLNRRVIGEVVTPFHYGFNSRQQSPNNSNELTITFKKNQHYIKSLYLPVIHGIGITLQTDPDTLVIIEGHTDSSGSEQYNLTLSEKRATQVAEAIHSQFSISQDRLKILGYGQAFPIASNTTKEGREMNRRVNTTLVQKFQASKEIPAPRWTIWSVDQMDNQQK